MFKSSSIMINISRNLPRCFPISIPEDDPFYSQFGKKCLDFTRSDTHCSGDQDQQVNTATSFIDGSAIYGTSEERALKLRYLLST